MFDMIINERHRNILFYFRQEIVHVEEEKRKLLVIGCNLCEDEKEREREKEILFIPIVILVLFIDIYVCIIDRKGKIIR